jgi:HD-GYP domain-containing protein (c-di-GMP phosphodiesterase class II)
MRLGERLGLGAKDLETLFDVSILTYVGCPVYGNESAVLFGDDIDFRAHVSEVDLAGFPAMMFMLRRAGHGTSAFNRARQAASLLAGGGRQVLEQMAAHCSAAGALAARLGLDQDVRAGVEQAYARWDGRGFPDDLSGDGVSLAARISHVAEACEVFHRTAGTAAALDIVRSRSGTHFDPEIAAAVSTNPEPLFTDLDRDTVEEVLATEPIERGTLNDDELDEALGAIGDFCDLRCPDFASHARTTADLVRGAADLMQLPAPEARLAYRAALVHDVGRFGVPGSVWAKPGPLTAGEQERARLHVYYVERIFSRPEPLRRIGLLAATHHERMDGSGYHRGVGAAMLSPQARVLAVADSYSAMRQSRPYRASLSEAAAARELRAEVGERRLDPAAVDAVLGAAGHRVNRAQMGGPAGLTPRESEVLALLTQGLPNKSIARQLDISPKTVSNHVEHIYSKLDVTNRTGAAMYAMQYGIAH